MGRLDEWLTLGFCYYGRSAAAGGRTGRAWRWWWCRRLCRVLVGKGRGAWVRKNHTRLMVGLRRGTTAALSFFVPSLLPKPRMPSPLAAPTMIDRASLSSYKHS